jgi:fumarate reductase (CoM/CoB) subunit A
LGGNALADTQVFGAIAGRSAEEFAEESEFNLKDIKEYADKLIIDIKGDLANKMDNENNEHNTKYNIFELINSLKGIMWDYVSIVRNEEGLKKALLEINDLKNKIENVKINGVIEIQKYLELKNMITVAEIIVKCALERKESRGAHYRSDYPETKDEWKGNLVVCKGNIKFVKL